MVPTAVHTQVRRKGNAANQEKYSIQCIQSKDNNGDEERLHDCGTDQIEEGEHSEDGNEHGVVDDRGIATDRFMDHISHECHDEESPEELNDVSNIAPDVLRIVEEWIGTWRARRPSWINFIVNGTVDVGVDRAGR